MEEGNVYKKLIKQLQEEAGQLFLVIDPPNQSAKEAGQMAKMAEEAGAAAICIGGSLGAQGKLLDDALISIKEQSKLPTILFPGNIASISKEADAIYFMSLINSTDPYYISGAQVASCFPIKKLGIEVIPTTYIVCEPGRAVGFMGRAHLVPRNLPYLAAANALAGNMMGSKLIILESGGGAPEPVTKEMIAYTKKSIDVPLIIAGGVNKPEYAKECIASGADIVHVGSAIEKAGSEKEALNRLKKLCLAVKEGAKLKK
ncbi:MAG: geranylgeranylglyceryl/heptaprenylglyceryl phosphate synthase [Candidatus ainarchaeum sp.]|nr:geranylgeranylglyceryl/heptaprenylglyceryl phosphate synthase [Candidatus ainarchaeum sp.]